MRITDRLAAAIITVLLTATTAGAQPAARVGQLPRPQPPAAPSTLSRLAQVSGEFEALAARVMPAVVQIVSTGFGGVQAEGATTGNLLTRQRVAGSGVILTADGFIVTNAHVVEGARRVQVVLTADLKAPAGTSIVRPAGRQFEGRVVGVDRETDLAVVKIDATGLPVLALGDSDTVQPGELVFAFGNPFGLENSVTMGVVSAVGRQRAADDPMVYVQTDAPINPGSSGGPLVDVEGRVVGINTFIVSQSGGSEGLGFAAPGNIVKAVADQIRNNGRVRRGSLGVAAQTITPLLAAGLQLPRSQGVVLSDVEPQGPADAAGLEAGDVVVSIDGKPMENARQFEVNVYQRRVGDTIAIDYLRGSEAKRTTAAVTERQNDPERFADLVDPDENLIPRLGILGIEVDKRLAAMIGNELRWPGGVLVAARAAMAPPGASALERGDVIIAVNGTNVAGLSDFRAVVDKLPSRAACVLHVQRGTRLLYVAIELE